jgi:type IV secretory pathway VirB10-like protein
MSDEDEDEFAPAQEHGSVPKAVAPQTTGIPGLRTPNRMLAPLALMSVTVIAFVFFWAISASRHATLPSALANTPLLVSDTDLSYHVPPAPSSTLAPPPTMTPQTPAPIAVPVPPLPPQVVAAAAPPEVTVRTPSAEEVFAHEERHRIIEARRASSKIALDSNGDLAQQTARDAQDLAQGAQMTSGGPGTGYHQQTTPSVDIPPAATAHQQFLAQRSGVTGYLPTRSPYQLTRGTIISARLLTTVDSTLPGGVIKAMVVATVKDSRTHSVTVLPIGTILTGEGDPQTVAGEARYLSVFDRIELPAPDSRTFFIGPNNAAGAQGENGMSVSVDTHAGRDFGNVFLRSVLQAGVNLASRASTVVDVGTSTGPVFTQGSRSAPTFHKYAGEPFTIIVAQNLALDRFMEISP